MNAIRSAREELANTIREATGFDIYDYEPDRLSPPCVLAVPPDSGTWITRTSYGALTVGVRILIITRPGDNKTALEALDEMASQVVDSLNEGVTNLEVSTPFTLLVNQTTSFPALSITCNVNIVN